MRAYQTLKADDGLEVMLFPLAYMNISQGEGGSYSHAGSKNIDFMGWNQYGRVLQCPYYAPCSLKCVAIPDPNANARVWQSIDKVHLADGTIDYVTIMFAHDDAPPTLNSVRTQGDLIGRTGTTGNVTGDHVHMNVAKGDYQGMEQVPPRNVWQLKNSISIYNACYVNDTVIVNGDGYNWKTWTGGVTPTPTIKKNKFPWYIIYKKRRNIRR